ncbi:Gfo/Idh/MocA family oxidoreductase [Amorphoplanes nipponensis]|uniref:Oxidoreductase n=1 Tax=Actinoplanes nipponensis TaxID=135950 RepID=A0A919JGB4_9ACTN|nr:Gfo/Idh/MocA family oxidoreductase [Actinoplanes nipponensis]GIE49133.1 oxidoreductase [Actinoplanes nipponensis]
MGQPLRVGIVGAGKISGQYGATLARLPQVAVTAVADLDPGRAKLLAEAQPGARVTVLPDLYAAPDVDVVLNLTTPNQHAAVALAAIAAGKHVYGEKPLAATGADGLAVLDAARSAGVRVACAPDTVLGTGVQTARAVVDAGEIGVPHAATAFMTVPGHERWHPDPEFYYQQGGGPLLDMGPYYLTALVHLLGPVRRVTGMSSRPRSERTIGDGPRAGTAFPVDIDTHVTGVLEHDSGALTTLLMSFDVWATRLPFLELYGPRGSLSLPDPNYFDGDVRLRTAGSDSWSVLPPRAGYAGAGRGVGLLDLAEALSRDRPHRAAADVALHVLDVMEAIQASARGGASVAVASTCRRPERIPELIGVGEHAGGDRG